MPVPSDLSQFSSTGELLLKFNLPVCTLDADADTNGQQEKLSSQNQRAKTCPESAVHSLLIRL